MNISVIRYILGWVVLLEGALFSLPTAVAVIYQEPAGMTFLKVMIVCMSAGVLLVIKKPKNTEFFAKEGFVVTAVSWILLSIIGALPFYLCGEIPSFVNALFETISGFTTTGATILHDVEALSHCTLFWRSFTHWIGGMGVLVFLLAILPMASGNNMHIMRAESPGPSIGKLVPKVRDTAWILYRIYIAITVAEIVILFISGMPLFDAITISFGTAGTGGFGIKNSSMADYTMFQQATVSIFMILFGINFMVYFLIISKKVKQAVKFEEMKWYLLIIALATLIISWDIRGHFASLFEAFHHALFQVASIITTTGFATCDFDLWSSTAKSILVLLMFIGACAGSTGGGIKVSRIVIMLKTIKKELEYYIHPRTVKKVYMEGRAVEHEVLRSVNIFFISFVGIFIFSVLIISLDNLDLTTNFTAVAATLNNVGPGLELVGPTQNFDQFSALSKFVMMFDMLAGRLEIFPLMILVSPYTWRR